MCVIMVDDTRVVRVGSMPQMEDTLVGLAISWMVSEESLLLLAVYARYWCVFNSTFFYLFLPVTETKKIQLRMQDMPILLHSCI